jgi:hypothetical protein
MGSHATQFDSTSLDIPTLLILPATLQTKCHLLKTEAKGLHLYTATQLVKDNVRSELIQNSSRVYGLSYYIYTVFWKALIPNT